MEPDGIFERVGWRSFPAKASEKISLQGQGRKRDKGTGRCPSSGRATLAKDKGSTSSALDNAVETKELKKIVVNSPLSASELGSEARWQNRRDALKKYDHAIESWLEAASPEE